jgi:hypothetical protein
VHRLSSSVSPPKLRMTGGNLSQAYGGDDKTVSPVLSKDLKLSKKSARWWRQLKATKMKKDRV